MDVSKGRVRGEGSGREAEGVIVTSQKGLARCQELISGPVSGLCSCRRRAGAERSGSGLAMDSQWTPGPRRSARRRVEISVNMNLWSTQHTVYIPDNKLEAGTTGSRDCALLPPLSNQTRHIFLQQQ